MEAKAGVPDGRMVHVWALKILLIPFILWLITALVVGYYLVAFPEAAPIGLGLWLVLAIVGAGAIVAGGYLAAYLYRAFYRWELGADEIRVWRGILFRKRITIPYARVQNVNVLRGPLLLLFRLASVEVETAGQKGMYYGGLYRSEGYLPGLADGDDVADAILRRIHGRGSGGGL